MKYLSFFILLSTAVHSQEFEKAVPFEKYLKKDQKGFCLTQRIQGHAHITRRYFFDLKNKRRYEVTPFLDIISIADASMDVAKQNKPCQFKDLK